MIIFYTYFKRNTSTSLLFHLALKDYSEFCTKLWKWWSAASAGDKFANTSGCSKNNFVHNFGI